MVKHSLFIVENESVPYDNRVWSEAKAVKELGYRVSIISPINERSNKKRYEEIDGIHIYRHPMPTEGQESKMSFLFEYINALFWQVIYSMGIFLRSPFNVIHSANPPDNIFLIAILFKLLGVKYIFDHHDICPENYLSKFKRRDLFYKLLLIMEKLNYKMSNIVISTNESYKKIAMKRGHKRQKDVFVVRNGPDLANVMFIPGNEFWKRGFKYLVAYVGKIAKEECIDVLLRCVRYVVFDKGVKDIRFIIVGKGSSLPEMMRFSESIGLEQYVEFTGFVPFKTFYEILTTADLCVNPEPGNSFTDKSTMVKIMDYMVIGKPIIQFNTTEGRVTAGDSAIYIDDNDETGFAEAIIALLNDPVKRSRMGELGRKRIFETLHWGKQKENLRQAYQYLEKSPEWNKNSKDQIPRRFI
jgi:glycosyltransferase involved in cell wall biosynthesis